MTIYKFSALLPSGEEIPLTNYRDKVLLIVNTASGCGFAPQLEGLENLYEAHKDQGFEVLAFPCNQFMGQEPLKDGEIASLCKLNYGTTFPFFNKVDVKGTRIHPLFKYLTHQAPGLLSGKIKWNFTKFLIDRKGNVSKRFAPVTKPEKIESAIVDLL